MPDERRYAMILNPREPECMPLGLMGEIWKAVGWAAHDYGYRAFVREETGAGVVWFEKETYGEDDDA